MAGKRLALLVATDQYQDPTFRQLRAPSADVEALRAVLADPAIGDYEVELLSNSSSHQVNQAIESFFAEAGLRDLVLLYFSGHGFKDDSGRLHLITKDSQRRLLASTAVSAQFVREQLDRCRSRRKVVVLDCCYAGAFPDGIARGTDTVDVLEKLSGRGSAVMTASSALGYAFESGVSSPATAINDIVTPSVFTGALIEGLATGSADQDGDGLIDVDELYDYVYKRVREAVPQQTPGRRGHVEGTLYVATSPRGPRPAQLPPEISQAVQNPLTSVRLAVVDDLVTLCSGAHPGTVMAVRAALIQLAEDDSRRVAAAAQSALDAINGRAGSPSFQGTFVAARDVDLGQDSRSEQARNQPAGRYLTQGAVAEAEQFRQHLEEAGKRLADAERRADKTAFVLTETVAALAPADPRRAAEFISEAEEAAQSITTDEALKAHALINLVDLLGSLDPARAAQLAADVVRLAQSLPPKHDREFFLERAVPALATADPDRAIDLARSITGEGVKAVALSKIAKALAATDRGRAAPLATEAMRVAESLTDGDAKDSIRAVAHEALDQARRVAAQQGAALTETETPTYQLAERASTAQAASTRPATVSRGPYVTPLVQKLAAEHGVDLTKVGGTGVGGRIRKQDVLEAAQALQQQQPRTARPTSAPPAAGGTAPAVITPGLSWPQHPAQLSYSAPTIDGGAQAERHAETTGNGKYGKVGRNEPCPCGSGRKYKLCHGDPRNRLDT